MSDTGGNTNRARRSPAVSGRYDHAKRIDRVNWGVPGENDLITKTLQL